MSDEAQAGCNTLLQAAPMPCYTRCGLLVYIAGACMQLVLMRLLVPLCASTELPFVHEVSDNRQEAKGLSTGANTGHNAMAKGKWPKKSNSLQ